MNNIILIGYMASGKSTVSKALSKKTGYPVMEIDELIEEKEGKTIGEIFESQGEDYFRAIESEVIKKVSQRENVIISCGGGAVLKDENIENMKKTGIIICLKVSSETVMKRTRNSTTRPLLRDADINKIEKMMKEREDYYYNASDYIIEADHKAISAIVNEILVIVKP